MAKYYRIWVEIEEIDEDNDTYKNVGEPMSIGGKVGTLDEAVGIQVSIVDTMILEE